VTTKTADLIVPHFPAVCGTVKHVAKSLIKVQREQAKAFVKDWIECEKNPVTMNHAFKAQTETLRKSALCETLRPTFHQAWEGMQGDAHNDDKDYRVRRVGESMGELEKRVQDTLVKAGHADGTAADSTAEAMEAVEMARMLSAYWKVATTRFVDVIVMGIDQVCTHVASHSQSPARLHFYVGCLLHSVAYEWGVACCATVLHTLGAVAYMRPRHMPTWPGDVVLLLGWPTNAQLGWASFGIPPGGAARTPVVSLCVANDRVFVMLLTVSHW